MTMYCIISAFLKLIKVIHVSQTVLVLDGRETAME